MEKIETAKAPAAIGPYSQGFRAGNLAFFSGQIPLDPETGSMVGDTIEAQTEQVMKNIGALLTAAGLSFENVVKTTCFLADMRDFAPFNEIYGKYFVGNPARSCVAVKALPRNALCEIEVIAEL